MNDHTRKGPDRMPRRHGMALPSLREKHVVVILGTVSPAKALSIET